MGVGLFMGALALVAVAIVVLVRRVVTSKDMAIKTAGSNVARAQARADAAGLLATNAMAQTDRALSVANQITTVAGQMTTVARQMDTLMSLAMGELIELPDRGRHAMRAPAQPAIADGEGGGYLE